LRDKLITALKIVVSLGLIAYLLSRVGLDRVVEVMRSASTNYVYLLIALILYFGAITVGCVKWQILLKAQKIEVPLGNLLSYTFVGLFFGNFLPTNVGGDLVRGYDLARHTQLPAEAAISVLVDRLVGLIAFVFVAVVMALLVVYSAGQAALWEVGVAATVAFLGLCGGFALMLSNRLRAQGRRLFAKPLLSPLAPLYDRLSAALSAYRRSYGALAQAFLISILVLIIGSVVNVLIALSLGGGISPLHIFLFTPLITFVLLIPISIGGIGLNQSAYVFFFNLVNVPESKSLAMSLIMQAVIIVASLPGGVLWWRKRSPRSPESGSEGAPSTYPGP
jgi:uncharacterized protein (TIRG00374 family)